MSEPLINFINIGSVILALFSFIVLMVVSLSCERFVLTIIGIILALFIMALFISTASYMEEINVESHERVW